MKIIISEKKVITWLILIAGILTCLSVLGQVSKFYLGHPRLFGFVYIFNLGSEGNIPTIFSTIIIFIAALITLFIFIFNKNNNKKSLYWFLVSTIFLYLAIDEGWSIHERLILSLNYLFSDKLPINYFLLIGGLFVCIIILLFICLSLSLPVMIRKWLYLSIILYIMGIFTLELVSIWYVNGYGGGFILEMISTLEEVLEILGIIFFIKTFLKFLKQQSDKIELAIKII